jgi:hypothetical protein
MFRIGLCARGCRICSRMLYVLLHPSHPFPAPLHVLASPVSFLVMCVMVFLIEDKQGATTPSKTAAVPPPTAPRSATWHAPATQPRPAAAVTVSTSTKRRVLPSLPRQPQPQQLLHLRRLPQRRRRRLRLRRAGRRSGISWDVIRIVFRPGRWPLRRAIRAR